MSITHLIDFNDRHWRVLVELGRRRPVCEALIPKDATIDDVDLFVDRVRTAMRRRLGPPAIVGGDINGETQRASESTVPGAHAQGQGQEESQPPPGGAKGGGDPPTSAT